MYSMYFILRQEQLLQLSNTLIHYFNISCLIKNDNWQVNIISPAKIWGYHKLCGFYYDPRVVEAYTKLFLIKLIILDRIHFTLIIYNKM
jgi:hypothetical protein